MHVVGNPERRRALSDAEERALEVAGLAEAAVELTEDGMGDDASSERRMAAHAAIRLLARLTGEAAERASRELDEAPAARAG